MGTVLGCGRKLAWILFLLLESCHAYEHCYFPTSAAYMYNGTVAVTPNGRVCQRWDSQTPQSHTYGQDKYFPLDGGYVAADNYCRSAGEDYLWCYTMDPDQRYEHCDTVPYCKNWQCANDATVGLDPSGLTATAGTDSGSNFIIKDTGTYGFSCCGTVSRWQFYISRPGTIHLQVWRLETVTGNYILLGENVFSYGAGGILITENIASLANRISTAEGDLIGWYSDDDMITSAGGSVDGNTRVAIAVPSVGDSVDFSTGATIENSRAYAIRAYMAANYIPVFTSTQAAVTIQNTESIGYTVIVAAATDTDVDDVATLQFSLDSTKFDIDASTGAVTLAILAPAVGENPLLLTVTDHCGATDTFSLTVYITNQTLPEITNLPGTASISESVNVETSIFDMTFSPAGTYTCNIDSYTPQIPTVNPFLTKISPTPANAVYLKSGANIRYNNVTSYTVTVTCVSGTASVTDTLQVNVDPNSPPSFDNWQDSVTINALTYGSGDTIYTANVTDAENDPITMAMTCTPSATCLLVLDIRNNREIYVTGNLRFLNESTYEVYMSADDGYNTVSSSLLTVVITDRNTKPEFTNMPITQTVLENTAAWTEVTQVSCNDAEGDTLSYSATFDQTGCATLFDVDSTNGSVTAITDIDYETTATSLLTCVLTVKAWDGSEYSDADNVTLTIVDIDEPPVFSSGPFSITTEEVVDNTVLPDQGISATDPESTAVTLALSCPDDPGLLDMDKTSGIVTTITALDVDFTGQASSTISCTVTAADATGETSTSLLDVVVTDANDNTPTFTSGAYSKTITPETDVGLIGQVNATDDDTTNTNNAISYNLTGSSDFIIDPDTGEIWLIANISAVTPGTTYPLTATATDGGGQSSSVTVLVIVDDVVTTTTATTSASSGFFDFTSNVIWFAICMALGTVLLGLCVYLAARFWRNSKIAAGGKEGLTKYKEKDEVKQFNDKDKSTKYDEKSKDEPDQRARKTPEKRPESAESGVSSMSSPRSAAPPRRPTTNDVFRVESENSLPGNVNNSMLTISAIRGK